MKKKEGIEFFYRALKKKHLYRDFLNLKEKEKIVSFLKLIESEGCMREYTEAFFSIGRGLSYAFEHGAYSYMDHSFLWDCTKEKNFSFWYDINSKWRRSL